MPWMIPPSTCDDAPSGLITRPTSWIAAIALDAHLARLHVDGDLGDLHAERQHLHPGRVRAARALAEDLRVLEQADDLLERPRAAVGADDVAALQRERALLPVVALRCDLDHLARRVGGRRAHGRAHRRDRRRARGDRRVRPARRVAGGDLDAVDRQAELLGGDLLHRRLRAGADVLHRRHDLRAPVGAEPDPRVRGRAAAAVPDLRREADAALPRRVAASPAPRARRAQCFSARS